mgnify:CR=1 FL=1
MRPERRAEWRLDRIMSGYGHDYFLQSPGVLADIQKILKSIGKEDKTTPSSGSPDLFDEAPYSENTGNGSGRFWRLKESEASGGRRGWPPVSTRNTSPKTKAPSRLRRRSLSLCLEAGPVRRPATTWRRVAPGHRQHKGGRHGGSHGRRHSRRAAVSLRAS